MQNTKILIAAENENSGIKAGDGCLTNGNCSMNTNQVLGIRNKQESNPETFVQDVILGGTFFIGTIVTISLVASGLILIFSGANDQWADKGKTGIKYSLVGLILVLFSYTIIRVIQYIAQG